jgi:peptidoglycan/LPS O-acetylase OafA/YrhL
MIRGLNGVRAIAFFLVFLLHTGYLKFGWVGVQLFFVLSGFLITDILLRMKSSLSLKKYLYVFFVRRALRILPLYYFFTTLIFLVVLYLINSGYKPFLLSKTLEQIPFAYAFLLNFFVSLRGIAPSPLLLHLWSLSIEEQFYLIWPLIIFLVPEKFIKPLFVLGIIAGPVFRLFFHIVYSRGLLEFMAMPSSLAMYTLPFSHLDAFAMGAYITRFEIEKPRMKLAYITLVTGFASTLITTGRIGEWTALGYPVTLPDAYQFIWAYSLLNYAFMLFIYCVAKDGLWLNILNSRPFDFLGRISYGLYIYHLPLIWFSTRLRDVKGLEEITPFHISLIALAATILISTFSFYLLEDPIIRLKDRLAFYKSISL